MTLPHDAKAALAQYQGDDDANQGQSEVNYQIRQVRQGYVSAPDGATESNCPHRAPSSVDRKQIYKLSYVKALAPVLLAAYKNFFIWVAGLGDKQSECASPKPKAMCTTQTSKKFV